MVERRWRWASLVLVLVMCGVGVAAPPAGADESCAFGVFAVDSVTGQLVIPPCAGSGPPSVVDSADWRGYPAVFAMQDDHVVVFYAVSPTGELWSRRRDAEGGVLGPPIRIAPEINWAQPVVFAPYPGHFVAHSGQGAPMSAFVRWRSADGSPTVLEIPPLFDRFAGPPVVGIAHGYAVGVWGGSTFRVLRRPNTSQNDDVWYAAGALPSGVSGVVNDSLGRLYGVAASGEAVRMAQAVPLDPAGCVCEPFDGRPWVVTDRAPGRYSRVIVPISTVNGEIPHIDTSPPCWEQPLPSSCLIRPTVAPWEWQTPPTN